MKNYMILALYGLAMFIIGAIPLLMMQVDEFAKVVIFIVLSLFIGIAVDYLFFDLGLFDAIRKRFF